MSAIDVLAAVCIGLAALWFTLAIVYPRAAMFVFVLVGTILLRLTLRGELRQQFDETAPAARHADNVTPFRRRSDR